MTTGASHASNSGWHLCALLGLRLRGLLLAALGVHGLHMIGNILFRW